MDKLKFIILFYDKKISYPYVLLQVLSILVCVLPVPSMVSHFVYFSDMEKNRSKAKRRKETTRRTSADEEIRETLIWIVICSYCWWVDLKNIEYSIIDTMLYFYLYFWGRLRKKLELMLPKYQSFLMLDVGEISQCSTHWPGKNVRQAKSKNKIHTCYKRQAPFSPLYWFILWFLCLFIGDSLHLCDTCKKSKHHGFDIESNIY